MSETSFTDDASRLWMEANPNRVRAMFAGHVIADTTGALTVFEPGREPIYFFPRKDVETGYLGKTGHKIFDSVKGEASCYTLVMEGEIVENAVCSYEDPAPGAEALRDYLCFAEGHFEIYELTPSDMAMAPRATHVHRSVA
ncbi:MAG: hypothetical protein JWO72_2411 [Caulobacteraceae bacterium]|jgi:uncharacterized protein (DUF427 family)|nr:hypothetical protein [Caulobacteraceae bacterium]